MKEILKYLKPLLFTCLNCGSLYCTAGYLCEDCYSVLKKYENKDLKIPLAYPYPIFSLYLWKPDQSNLLSRMFSFLKGTRSNYGWAYFAPIFVQRRISFEIESAPIRIVPAPSTSGGVDHATLWAKNLAAITGGTFTPCLLKKGKGKQKQLKSDERRKIEISLIEKYSELTKTETGTLWIFVDDVLTTGSTSLAAFEALGCPEHFEVWVLGHRSLSCEGGKVLL